MDVGVVVFLTHLGRNPCFLWTIELGWRDLSSKGLLSLHCILQGFWLMMITWKEYLCFFFPLLFSRFFLWWDQWGGRYQNQHQIKIYLASPKFIFQFYFQVPFSLGQTVQWNCQTRKVKICTFPILYPNYQLSQRIWRGY